MSSPKAAPRAAVKAVAASLALTPTRAEASRKNGAKSRGPRTPDGKARAARNALRHGMRAEQHVVVEGESAEAFAALEAALVDELAPAGVLQTLLAGRIARAAWRLERAERIEAELFEREMKGVFGDGDLGLALIRDGKGARAFDTLLRYRGTAQAEFSRALRLLKALQAEEGACRAAERPEASPSPESPNEPEARIIPDESRWGPGRVAASPTAAVVALAATQRDGPAPLKKKPDEPESRENPCDWGRLVESAFRQGLRIGLGETAGPTRPG